MIKMNLEQLKKQQKELEVEMEAWVKLNPIIWKKAYLKHNEVLQQIRDLEKVVPEHKLEPVVSSRPIFVFKPKKKK